MERQGRFMVRTIMLHLLLNGRLMRCFMQKISVGGRSSGKDSKSGFTLIELLVVIGIITILISMLLPAINMARNAALTVACLSNQRQIGMALQQYILTNRGTVPDPYIPYSPGLFWYSHDILGQYLGRAADDQVMTPVYWCPAVDRPPNNPTVPSFNASSYAVNYLLYALYPTAINNNWEKMTSIRNPQSIIWLVDGAWAGPQTFYYYTSFAWSLVDRVSYRHHKAVNALFLDGHAVTIKRNLTQSDLTYSK